MRDELIDRLGEAGVTLLVGGTLITGRVVELKRFRELQAQQTFDATEGLSEDVRARVKPTVEGTILDSDDETYVHLSEAAVILTTAVPVRVPTLGTGGLYRVRWDRIDAYSLGLASVERLPDETT